MKMPSVLRVLGVMKMHSFTNLWKEVARNLAALWVTSSFEFCSYFSSQTSTIFSCFSLVDTASGTNLGNCKDVLKRCKAAKPYCYDLVCLNLMRQPCRKICGFCPGEIHDFIKKHCYLNSRLFWFTENCNDTNSNCASSLSHCYNPSYRDFMKNFCRYSCKFCGGSKLLQFLILLNWNWRFLGICKDELPTCAENKQLCSRSAYKNIIYTKCWKTCEVC